MGAEGKDHPGKRPVGWPEIMRHKLRSYINLLSDKEWVKEWAKKVVLLFGLVFASYFLGTFRPVHHAQLALWDAILSSTSPPPSTYADDIQLVVITGDDYKSAMFKSTSPLNSDSLATLIATAISYGASCVFVDISTEDDSFKGIVEKVAMKVAKNSQLPGDKLCKADPKNEEHAVANEEPHARFLRIVHSKVVWARGYAIKEDGGLGQPLAVLGGNLQQGDVIAYVAVRADSDGRVRGLTRLPDSPALWDVAADALRALGKEQKQKGPEKAEDVQPNFVRALGLLKSKETPATRFMSDLLIKHENVKDKVVFLGGAYSCDNFYMADGGMHSGVRVLTSGALALKNNDVLDEMSVPKELSLKFVLGLIVMWVNDIKKLSAPMKLLFILVGLPVICVALAVVLRFVLSFILDLGAFLFGILLEQSVEGTLHSDSAG